MKIDSFQYIEIQNNIRELSPLFLREDGRWVMNESMLDEVASLRRAMST
jgi:hypothetical protein